jgi:hypothetical protein
MASFLNCRARLEQAAGRELTDAEIEKLGETIHRAALAINRGEGVKPKTGQGAAVDQTIAQVAQEAAKQLASDRARAERNASLQAVKLAQRADDVKAMQAAGLTPLDALGRLIANRADGRANKFSLEDRYLGVVADMKRRVNDTWAALGNDFLGFVQDADKIKLLIREMRGERTGDAMAKKGADAWLKMTEEFRKRFNDGGGDMGKLDNWGLPQHHSQELVARAGKDTWINAVLPALDRTKYVDDLGRGWDDARLRDFLGHAWDTIATNGYANLKPGEFRGSGRCGQPARRIAPDPLRERRCVHQLLALVRRQDVPADPRRAHRIARQGSRLPRALRPERRRLIPDAARRGGEGAGDRRADRSSEGREAGRVRRQPLEHRGREDAARGRHAHRALLRHHAQHQRRRASSAAPSGRPSSATR